MGICLKNGRRFAEKAQIILFSLFIIYINVILYICVLILLYEFHIIDRHKKGLDAIMSRINNSYYAILGILGFGSMSGYGIKTWVDEGIGYFWEIDYKQIYPTLKKLVDSNLVVYKTEKNGNRPESKVYTITEEGLEELKKWLCTPIGPSKNNKSELMLKLFFGYHSPLAVNLQHIKRFKDETLKRLEALKKVEKKMSKTPIKDASWHYCKTTLMEGQIQCRADIEWCDHVTDYLVDQKNLI